jgi:DNA-binding Lrp family transcriptional regulator
MTTTTKPPREKPARRGRRTEIAIDDVDRHLLRELIADSTVTYAELGGRVGLSAPATHDRVRRLRQTGVIQNTGARVDPALIGKPLLAFVHVNTNTWAKHAALLSIARYPEVEEIHSVAGDASLVLKVRSPDTQALEDLLAQLYATPGVVSTSSYIVLSSLLERPVQAEITDDWPAIYPTLEAAPSPRRPATPRRAAPAGPRRARVEPVD